jgi:hypothetical protein
MGERVTPVTGFYCCDTGPIPCSGKNWKIRYFKFIKRRKLMSDYLTSGVYLDEESNTWCACIECDGRIISIGSFPDAWEAYFEWNVAKAKRETSSTMRDAIVGNAIHHLRRVTKDGNWKSAVTRYLEPENDWFEPFE